MANIITFETIFISVTLTIIHYVIYGASDVILALNNVWALRNDWRPCPGSVKFWELTANFRFVLRVYCLYCLIVFHFQRCLSISERTRKNCREQRNMSKNGRQCHLTVAPGVPYFRTFSFSARPKPSLFLLLGKRTLHLYQLVFSQGQADQEG